MATFWEIYAHSVSNLFSLYFVCLNYLFISLFGVKSGICLLIAPVPVHCFSITFIYHTTEISLFGRYNKLVRDLFETKEPGFNFSYSSFWF